MDVKKKVSELGIHSLQAKSKKLSYKEAIEQLNTISSDNFFIIDKNTNSITSIMGTVDTACYAAKDAGRNRVVIYNESDQDVSRRRGDMDWVRRIKDAIEQNKFCLYSQKIIEVRADKATKPSYELF